MTSIKVDVASREQARRNVTECSTRRNLTAARRMIYGKLRLFHSFNLWDLGDSGNWYGTRDHRRRPRELAHLRASGHAGHSVPAPPAMFPPPSNEWLAEWRCAGAPPVPRRPGNRVLPCDAPVKCDDPGCHRPASTCRNMTNNHPERPRDLAL